jgi:hypothetical protein
MGWAMGPSGNGNGARHADERTEAPSLLARRRQFLFGNGNSATRQTRKATTTFNSALDMAGAEEIKHGN